MAARELFSIRVARTEPDTNKPVPEFLSKNAGDGA
jgi:hypothetical protein